MLKFTIATLAIVALLLIGALVGGVWIWAGLIYITVFAYAFDRLTPLFFQNADTDAEFPTSDALGVALAFAHFIVLGAVVYTLVHNATLPMLQKIALFCATALFAGQIGHPNAHELIHRPNRLLRRLGKAVYMSISARYSWNTPHRFSGAMMLNAPRHSDHHTHPSRSYPSLELLEEEMPMLPYSLPMMAVIALMPPLWRRVMDSRVETWENRA